MMMIKYVWRKFPFRWCHHQPKQRALLFPSQSQPRCHYPLFYYLPFSLSFSDLRFALFPADATPTVIVSNFQQSIPRAAKNNNRSTAHPTDAQMKVKSKSFFFSMSFRLSEMFCIYCTAPVASLLAQRARNVAVYVGFLFCVFTFINSFLERVRSLTLQWPKAGRSGTHHRYGVAGDIENLSIEPRVKPDQLATGLL